MKLKTSTLFLDDVKDSEGKKLGEVVNLVFNSSNHSAWILIFPEKKAWSNLKSLLDLGVDITKDAINQYPLPFSEKWNSFIKGAAGKTTEHFKKNCETYLADMQEKLISNYYMIPAGLIKESREKELILKDKESEYTGFIKYPVFNEALVYYGEEAYEDNKSRHKITLGKGRMQGQIITDAEITLSYIKDIIIDVDTSMVTEISVMSIGKGAGEKTVAINNIDFTSMKCNVPFR